MRSSDIPSTAQDDMRDRYPKLREQEQREELDVAEFYSRLDGE